jgi:hypothetical protein
MEADVRLLEEIALENIAHAPVDYTLVPFQFIC